MEDGGAKQCSDGDRLSETAETSCTTAPETKPEDLVPLGCYHGGAATDQHMAPAPSQLQAA